MFEKYLKINVQNESTNTDEFQKGDLVLVRYRGKQLSNIKCLILMKYMVLNLLWNTWRILKIWINLTKTEKDPEKFEVDRDDIILMLPAPNVVATRRGQQLSFPMSFDGCNLG